jgi:hypothetical protein
VNVPYVNGDVANGAAASSALNAWVREEETYKDMILKTVDGNLMLTWVMPIQKQPTMKTWEQEPCLILTTL